MLEQKKMTCQSIEVPGSNAGLQNGKTLLSPFLGSSRGHEPCLLLLLHPRLVHPETRRGKNTVQPVNSTPLNSTQPVNTTLLNSTKPVNSNMSFGTRFAFPYDNVPLNSTSLQIALLFRLYQGYVLFTGFIVKLK
jgi:hypothetical protein